MSPSPHSDILQLVTAHLSPPTPRRPSRRGKRSARRVTAVYCVRRRYRVAAAHHLHAAAVRLDATVHLDAVIFPGDAGFLDASTS